ncbi:MAG: hypothetical protein J0H11_23655 [Rhizobiales bacterium]|nr:hypothetical protein [Hyphomicrobiales bacterium]
MANSASETTSGEYTYEEREAVGIFSDEASLNAAVDALMQAGLRQEDMSVLGHSERLAGMSVQQLEDRADAPRAAYSAPDARVEGLAALTGGPALVVGLGAAAVLGSAGAALIPTIAITAGSAAGSGAVGLLLARLFGRKHGRSVEDQIAAGGLLLWVHAADSADDEKILGILKSNGAKDVHVHVLTKNWGVDEVPLHDFNPDPLLK